MARKSKEFQRLFREESVPHRRATDRPTPQSVRKKELAAYDRFKKQVESNLKDKKRILAPKPKGMPKMSEVLQAFIDPYVDDRDTYEERKEFLDIAVLAWNLAVSPPEAQQEFFKEAFGPQQTAPFDKREISDLKLLQNFIQELIEWKLEAFPDDTRLIEEFQLTEHELGFHLSVAYTLS